MKVKVNSRRRALGAVSLLAVAAGAVAGCGSSGTSSSSTSGGGGAAHRGKQLAIVEMYTGDGYNTQWACGAVAEGKRLGFDVDSPQGPPQFDPARQAAVTSAVLARDPAALVYDAADAKSGIPPIKAAVASGLRVAAVDTRLADPSMMTTFAGTNHYDGGRVAGQELLREIGGKGKVLMVGSIPDHPITVGRIDGFESVVKNVPGVTLLPALYPPLDPAKVAAAVAAKLRANPDIKGIYTTNNVFNAAGVVTALRDAGLTGKVKVVSWDYDPIGAKYLKSGDLSALVSQRPSDIGRMAVDQLANAIDGKPVQRFVSSPVTLVTQANMSTPAIGKLYYGLSC